MTGDLQKVSYRLLVVPLESTIMQDDNVFMACVPQRDSCRSLATICRPLIISLHRLWTPLGDLVPLPLGLSTGTADLEEDPESCLQDLSTAKPSHGVQQLGVLLLDER